MIQVRNLETKKVMEKTQVFDAEDLIKVLFKLINDGRIITSYKNIINVHSDNSEGLRRLFSKQGVIILRLSKALV